MGKQFDIVEYGVCYVEDILGEIPESSLVVSSSLALTVVDYKQHDYSSRAKLT